MVVEEGLVVGEGVVVGEREEVGMGVVVNDAAANYYAI